MAISNLWQPRKGGLWLLLLAAYAVIDLALPIAARWGREPGWDAQGLAIEMGCMMASYGAVVAQWSVLAVWSALGTMRWPMAATYSWAAAAALLATYLHALTYLQAAAVERPSVWFAPLALLAMQLPFLGCRAILGWRLERGDLTRGEPFRFTIRDSLAITAAVAVILAVGRSKDLRSTSGGMGGGGGSLNLTEIAAASHGLRWDYQRGQTEACLFFALAALGLVLPVFFSLFAVRRKAVAGLLPAATLLCAAGLAAAASWAVSPGMSFAGFASEFAAPVLAGWKQPNGGQSFSQLLIAVAGLFGGWASVAIPSFLLFRLSGYRLTRRCHIGLVLMTR